MITFDSYVSKPHRDAVAAEGKRRQTISRKLFLRIIAVCEFAADFLTCAGAMFAACTLRFHSSHSASYPLSKALAVSVFAGLFAVVLLHRKLASSGWSSLHPVRETEAAIRMSVQSLLVILPASFLLRLDVPRGAIVLAFVLMLPLLVLQKQLFASMIQRLHNLSYGTERVVIYGAGETGRRIASRLLCSPLLGLRPVAVIDEKSGSADECRLELAYGECHAVPVQWDSITANLLESLRCNLLLVQDSSLSSERLAELREVARQAGVPVAHLSDPSVQEGGKQSIESDGLPLTHERAAIVPWGYAFGKRIVDLIVSSFLLLLLSPVFIVIALLIRLSSPGPAFFVQRRVGRDGTLFKMYKFRSMSCSTRRYERSPKTSSDPRITKIGRFLRRTSLDELPQLVNVFRGEMSLVGPRPEMPFIVRGYSAHQRQRLQVIPGITGLWQLSPDRAFPIHENVHHDLSYISDRTLYMDVAILIHTLFFAMRGGV